MLKILIEDSEGKSKIAPFNPDQEITIGRKEGNSIRLKERNVSRQHARIYSTPDGLFIEPVAARYGLKVNSTKIDGPTPIECGDEIRIGDYRLYIHDETQPDIREDENLSAVKDIDPQLRPKFVVISSNFAGCEYIITKTKIVIGRNPNCDIHIQHQSVSAAHAEVRRTPRGDFEIRDLGSSNGTIVNNVHITDPVCLNSGDIVTLGHVIMRYCAPGELWSLNFGINEEKKHIPIPLIALIALCAIIGLVILIIFTTKTYMEKTAHSSNAVTQTASAKDEQISKLEKFNSAIAQFNIAIENGDFQKAEDALATANAAVPNNQLVEITSQKMQKEKEAKEKLDEIVSNIAEGKCREALDAIPHIAPDSWANKEMIQNGIQEQAQTCRKDFLIKRAFEALQNNDPATAEMARDEIQMLDRTSPEIEKINEALNSKKPSRSGSGRRSASQKNNDNAAEPKPAKIDTAALCRDAVQAKINKDYCKAYSLYKKALNAGVEGKCKQLATDFVAENKNKCGG